MSPICFVYAILISWPLRVVYSVIYVHRMMITMVSKVIDKLGMICMVSCQKSIIWIRSFLRAFKEVSREFPDWSHGSTADDLIRWSILFGLVLGLVKISCLVYVMGLNWLNFAGKTDLIGVFFGENGPCLLSFELLDFIF